MEFILIDSDNVYKLDSNLNLSLSRNEKIIFTQPLVKRKVEMFSADIDDKGHIHIAAVCGGALTYIKYSDRKTSTVHLMHLPENFSITSLIINCENHLRLNYCVKSKSGCAVIEYTKSGDSWQGKNIYTCHETMILKYVKKNKNECFVVKNNNNLHMLINAYEPETVIFESISPINEVQGVFDGILWATDEAIYFNGGEISKGHKVYAPDLKRVLIKDDGKLKEFSLDNGSRYCGEATMPANAKEYILCVAKNDKRKVISTPFPYIRFEPQMKVGAGILEEVYMQQRSLFQLQAEVKSLKSRVKRLEDALLHYEK